MLQSVYKFGNDVPTLRITLPPCVFSFCFCHVPKAEQTGDRVSRKPSHASPQQSPYLETRGRWTVAPHALGWGHYPPAFGSPQRRQRSSVPHWSSTDYFCFAHQASDGVTGGNSISVTSWVWHPREAVTDLLSVCSSLCTWTRPCPEIEAPLTHL